METFNSTISSDFGNYTKDRGSYGSSAMARYYLYYALAACLVGIVIVIGNLMVIISVIKFHNLRTPTNYIIVSLAVADLMVGVILVPVFSMYGTEYSQSIIFACVSSILDAGLCTVSVVHILAVNVDRYIAITRPLTYQTIVTSKKVFGWIVFLWVFGIGVFLLPFALFEDARIYCAPRSIAYGIYFVVAYSGFNFLAMALVVVIYIHIFRIGLKHIKAVQSTENASGKSTILAHWKMIQTVGIVLGIFILCWAPFLVYFFLINNGMAFSLAQVHMIYSFALLGMANSSANPLIYAATQVQFRNAFKKLLGIQINKNPDMKSSQASSKETTDMKSSQASFKETKNDN